MQFLSDFIKTLQLRKLKKAQQGKKIVVREVSLMR